MKASLGLRMGASLTMTPALQQAIRLLQLSSLDLQQEIQQALDSNVMLEADDEGDSAPEPVAEMADVEPASMGSVEVSDEQHIPEEMPVDAEWSDVYDGATASSGSSSDEETRDFLQTQSSSGTSLQDHLGWQATLAPLDETGRSIAAHLIDAINDDGYLENWPELHAQLLRLPDADEARIAAVLALVQDFDPAGVGARDLSECLSLQLRQLPDSPERAVALTLVRAHLPLLARKDAAVLAKATGAPLEQAQAALTLIQGLQPHPGRPYQAHENDYVAPDVFVARKNGRWKVSLNPDHLPRLRINSHYQGFIKRADSSRDQVTLKNHLQEARYFINALESRNETLLRVAQCIVEEQRAFLEYGPEAMRPLVLRDVSEQLGIHESTVSRATANKYMHTPRGLFELKYFFSSHVATTQGGAASATAIQAMIKRLIAAEQPHKPLSDATLAEHLLKDGLQVARRTVAKYREGLGIPPSHERKPPG